MCGDRIIVRNGVERPKKKKAKRIVTEQDCLREFYEKI